MTKVSITGSRKRLQDTINCLHELELLDIDDYDGELETGNPFEEAEEISELLVDIRSVLSKIPEVQGEETGRQFDLNDLEEDIEDVKKRVERLEEERTEVEEELSRLSDQERFFRKLDGIELEVDDLSGTETLEAFIGKFEAAEFRQKAEIEKFDVFEGKTANVLLYHDSIEDKVGELLQEIDAEEIAPVETSFSGPIETVVEDIESRRQKLEIELEEYSSELERIAEEWRERLEKAEEFLEEKVEKAEAPLSFATTERAFVAEGWLPSESLDELRGRLERETDGKVHIEEEKESEENPPVKYHNSKVVQPFESLTDLISVPRYSELDPSFMIFLTFPIMFGFMIGDAGYGLSTLLIFYAGYRMFPEAKDIFVSLMYASVATIVFGLAFGDAFGYVIFGSHSELAHATGIHLFEKIPILFHRAEHLGSVFKIAALTGIAHVNIGYLLGGYNEYVNHGAKEAFLEKGSWILLEIAAALWYFVGTKAGAPVMALSVVLLYLGEGIEGVVEIPSLISNVLSYLRIFGVSVAAVSLAAVVNAMAHPLFEMHSVVGLVLGFTVLFIGHLFNSFIKIMEGFLQGIRLHYVELFTKFFEGGGRKYDPFGARKIR